MSATRFSMLWAMIGLVGGLAGCSPSEEITQVRVPAEISERREKPEVPSKPEVNPELPAPSGPKFKAPEGWTVQPNAPMRALSLAVLDGEQKCDISLIRLGPDQSVLDNVNRWRGQVKIANIDEATLAEQVQSIQCGGHPASMVQAVGETETIFGVIVPRPGATWFVKLQGPNGLALREKEKFIAFTESIELP